MMTDIYKSLHTKLYESISKNTNMKHFIFKPCKYLCLQTRVYCIHKLGATMACSQITGATILGIPQYAISNM